MKHRLLLIEDDGVDQEIVQRCVQRSSVKYDIDIVETVQLGCELIRKHKYLAVLTDLDLPDASGEESVCRIRKAAAEVPIIVLSGQSSEEVALRTIQNGAQDFVSKSELTTPSIDRLIQCAVERQKSFVEIRNLNRELKENADLLLSQQKQLEEKNRKLRQLYQTAHTFVDNVSHEFRTPLAVVKDYVSIVGEGMAGDINEQQKNMLDVVGVRADDLNNMVDDMLDVSKLESGMLGAWRRECRIEDVFAHVMSSLQRKADVKKIDLQVAMPESTPTLYCDSEKVGRVIINLVTNAMKFCGDPGVVQVVCTENVEAGELLVEVHDNGEGIDPQDLEAIFTRFKQVKSDIRCSTKGFGLGLNIARELVDINFGEMDVQSTRGRGSCFSFTIPIADPVLVTRRYLGRVQEFDHETDSVSLLKCRINRPATELECDDLDAFLQTILRRYDMAFQVIAGEWLMISPVSGDELNLFIKRVLDERDRANRNRIRSDLPEFELGVISTEKLPNGAENIMGQFVKEMQSATKPEILVAN